MNNFVVSSPPAPQVTGYWFFNYPHLVQWVSFVSRLVHSTGYLRRGERTLGPLSCSALLASPLCCPAIYCWYSFRYGNTMPVLSLTWSYLYSKGNESGIAVMLVAPWRLTAAAAGQKSQSRIGGQREQGKQGTEWNSSNFSVSCWVFLCVMSIWGSWGCFEALGSVLLCP